jgi:hypothetical protein
VPLTGAHDAAADAIAAGRVAQALAERFGLDAPAHELHTQQIGWARAQAESLTERKPVPEPVEGSFLRRPVSERGEPERVSADRPAAGLDAPAHELHTQQIGWARAQAESLTEYFIRIGRLDPGRPDQRRSRRPRRRGRP